ncbi:AMP-dependent synthetase/ligase [[Limnothrix rosea] IAM M-220]|uniref:AMP-dependent synthetase/ligase n=1 Tax=[Limnothrix rosea] IAM M-220 TaxID=454133 RepID=UPI0009621A28|nr:long-chain fatty acid--CoA ligase [[Limnothrix rosea] IAM M-220]OKH19723.1 long-chain fatty acid--CoA ligase [[Limnothrix rosea] IAM M-220]
MSNSAYANIQSLSEIWAIAAEMYGDVLALYDPHSEPEMKVTYTQLWQQIQQFGAGLQALGIQPGEKVALIADNSLRWFIADQGTIATGAVNAVRSSQAEKTELLYIYEDSESQFLIAENLETFQRFEPEISGLQPKAIILLSDEDIPDSPLTVLNFSQLMALGNGKELTMPRRSPSDLMTLIYTSGTTGKPKGVMLSHGNLLYQVQNLDAVMLPNPGDKVLSILPTWHSYERTAEYYLLSKGCTQIYTSIRHIKKDLKTYKPAFMVAVPRIWESIYEGVQKNFREQPANKQKLVNFFIALSSQYVLANRIAKNLSLEHLYVSSGTRLINKLKAIALLPLHLLGEKLVYNKIREATGGKIRYVISGGGSLAQHIDTFFEMVGINILVGYGLTETSPVTNARRPERNVRGSSGPALPGTEVRIVDLETRQNLPQGEKGLVLLKGPQIMQGYYRKPEATAKAIDKDGWFDSGDIGWLTPQGDLVLTGRAKDTIVLSNGENIEPQPIEDACARSAYIDQIMLVGQDQKSLGALIVPNLEALEKWITDNSLGLTLPDPATAPEALHQTDLYSKAVVKLFKDEITREVKNRPGYRPDDRITNFALILEPFSMENGLLTQTLKMKRPIVTQKYQGLIDELYA